jgi:hypothetical protein
MAKELSLRKALEALGKPGARLMLMSTNASPEGRVYFVVPGGYVTPETAKAIISRPDVISSQDGLFPGHSQTYQFAR